MQGKNIHTDTQIPSLTLAFPSHAHTHSLKLTHMYINIFLHTHSVVFGDDDDDDDDDDVVVVVVVDAVMVHTHTLAPGLHAPHVHKTNAKEERHHCSKKPPHQPVSLSHGGHHRTICSTSRAPWCGGFAAAADADAHDDLWETAVVALSHDPTTPVTPGRRPHHRTLLAQHLLVNPHST